MVGFLGVGEVDFRPPFLDTSKWVLCDFEDVGHGSPTDTDL
jgi:hypothetical protein